MGLAAALATLLLHALLLDGLWRLDAAGLRDAPPPRLQAIYVRLLEPRPVVLSREVPLPARAVARPRGPWITVPELPAIAEPPPPEPGASAPRLASAASAPSPIPDAAAGPAADTPTPTAADPAPVTEFFDWPPSTRLRYALVGHWRGPVEGRARVEWVREGDRYQVHLDIAIGLEVAPLIARRMTSDGRLGPQGLQPARYDEHTRVLWRAPVQLTLFFEPGRVTLPGGLTRRTPPDVQDAVSQFVQLAWRFTRDPSLLTPGGVVVVPLALPRSVGDWTYDVREAEPIATPAGPVDTVRLAPRRQPQAGGELVPEMWFAPALQYLPVRIRVRGAEDSVVELTMDQLPEQAAPPPPPTLPGRP